VCFTEDRGLGFVHTKCGVLQIAMPKACFDVSLRIALQVHSMLKDASCFSKDAASTSTVFGDGPLQESIFQIKGTEKNPWRTSSKQRESPMLLFQVVAVRHGSDQAVGRSIPFCLYRDDLTPDLRRRCFEALSRVSDLALLEDALATADPGMAARVNEFWESCHAG
jgi:hypothetical protein